MEKNIDWGNLPFGYVECSKSFVANFKDGKWDEGTFTSDHTVTLSECAGVLQYAQTCFEGLKAYTTPAGKIVTFRPDLNASRMADSCRRLEMPVFPEDRFVQAVIAGEHQVGTLGELRAFLKEIFARAHGENGKTDQYVSDKSFHILFHLSG